MRRHCSRRSGIRPHCICLQLTWRRHCCRRWGSDYIVSHCICRQRAWRIHCSQRWGSDHIVSTVKKQRKIKATGELAFSFPFTSVSQPMEWCCPLWKWGLPLQWANPLQAWLEASLIYTISPRHALGACFLCNYRLCQIHNWYFKINLFILHLVTISPTSSPPSLSPTSSVVTPYIPSSVSV